MTILHKIIFIALLIISTNLKLTAQHQLKIGEKTYFKVTDQVNLNLKDCQLTNNGNLHLSHGTVSILGNGADTLSRIDGDSICSFFQLAIDKSGNHVALGQNIIIQDSLLLKSGQIVLNDYDLLLNQGADFYQQVDSSYVQTNGIGQLRKILSRTKQIYPIGLEGYFPITLDNLGGPDTFSVRLEDYVLEQGITGDTINESVLDITWLVEKGTMSSSESRLNITVQWLDAAELTNFNREKIYLSHYTDSAWDKTTITAATGSDPYTVTRNNVVGLSPFTVFSEDCPATPIKLPVSVVIKRGSRRSR